MCVVLGGGGHTQEMIEILKACPLQVSALDLIVSREDFYSESWTAALKRRFQVTPQVHRVPRPNAVCARYSPLKILRSFLWALKTLAGVRGADVLLCNGPGLCVPVGLAHRLLHPGTPLVYIESLTRIKRLSLSGRLLQFVASLFLVQSRLLARDRWPRRQYARIFAFRPSAGSGPTDPAR